MVIPGASACEVMVITQQLADRSIVFSPSHSPSSKPNSILTGALGGSCAPDPLNFIHSISGEYIFSACCDKLLGKLHSPGYALIGQLAHTT